MTVQSTVPSAVQQAVSEDITWGIDMTALLSGSQTPTSPTSQLLDPDGNAVTLTDAPTIAGNLVFQRIRANVLKHSNFQGGLYTLQITFTPSSTTNVLVTRTQVQVTF